VSAGPGAMRVVHGLDGLEPSLGRLFVVIGVFDGLHLGHQYLLEHLVREARRLAATPSVLTFDHHPDEVLTGNAPPLLCDPDERLDRLEDAGIGVTIVQTFDVALRETPFDAFVRRIADGVDLAGFLMTPESAFGFERRGTPETVASLGRQLGYEVVVVPPFTLDGSPVSSSEIRRSIVEGDLDRACRLLGRPISFMGRVDAPVGEGARIAFDLPVVLPPSGRYPVLLAPAGAAAKDAADPQDASEQALVAIEGRDVRLLRDVQHGRRIRLTFA
jgi:riboflavin kinase / FMN adenylyltransferase